MKNIDRWCRDDSKRRVGVAARMVERNVGGGFAMFSKSVRSGYNAHAFVGSEVYITGWGRTPSDALARLDLMLAPVLRVMQ